MLSSFFFLDALESALTLINIGIGYAKNLLSGEFKWFTRAIIAGIWPEAENAGWIQGQFAPQNSISTIRSNW